MNPIDRRISPEIPTSSKLSTSSQGVSAASSQMSQDSLQLSNTNAKPVQAQGVLASIMRWLDSVVTRVKEWFGQLFRSSSAQSVQAAQVTPNAQPTQATQSSTTTPTAASTQSNLAQNTAQIANTPQPPQPVDAQPSSDNQSKLQLGLTSENDTVMGVVYVDGKNTQGQLAAGVKDGKVSAKASAEKVTDESTLKATAAYDNGTTSASLEYQNPTTEAELHYLRQSDLTTMGGKLTKNYDHSTVSLSGDYLKNSVGTGYRVDGTWKTDDIGEKVMGYTVHGEASVGAMKLPGQNLNTSASGRVVGEKENSSFFLGVQHQNGPMFNNPDTRVEAGFSMKF